MAELDAMNKVQISFTDSAEHIKDIKAELIKNGENGYLVPVGDIDEMRDKLSSLMKEQSKIKQFGEKSIITVQRYEEEKVVEQWKEVINGLL